MDNLKVAKLIRLLLSDHDGEVLAAVAAIKRIADLHELAALVERSASAQPNPGAARQRTGSGFSGFDFKKQYEQAQAQARARQQAEAEAKAEHEKWKAEAEAAAAHEKFRREYEQAKPKPEPDPERDPWTDDIPLGKEKVYDEDYYEDEEDDAEMFEYVYERRQALRGRDLEFIEDIRSRFAYYGSFTPKQRKWVRDLYERLGG